MARINENFLNLKQSYLFSDIAKRVAAYKAENPDKKIISLGIGDVTLPLCETVVAAMKDAVLEMGKKESFRGYGPEQGYDFLRGAVAGYYAKMNVSLDASEIFISDGAKSDIGNIADLFANDNTVLIPDPVYPVYVDSNIMLGRKIIYIDGTAENHFSPVPDGRDFDIVYLCSPNNPTGAAYTQNQLRAWVDAALEKNAIILYDAAYEAYIEDPSLPHSIYQIKDARRCAVEFSSLSKTAGFTGTRCGYTVIPRELTIKSSSGEDVSLSHLWNRRQTTKFNGVPYVVQRAAEAVFSDEGQLQSRYAISCYKKNAAAIASLLARKGFYFTGGINSPYIWMKCPGGMASWDFFDHLLKNVCVVGTPGAGFGKNGEGFFRLTGFGSADNTVEAIERLERLL